MKTLSAICAEKRRDNSNVWVKLPQIVKSKITNKLSDREILLAELKFSLLLNEMYYNNELAELLSLSRRYVLLKFDELPLFNRRHIVILVKRLKKYSDEMVRTAERNWMNPNESVCFNPDLILPLLDKTCGTSYAIACLAFVDMFDEMRRLVKRNAKREDLFTQVYSIRMNCERILAPFHRLASLRATLRRVVHEEKNKGSLQSVRQSLDNISVILDRCYEVLTSLHGPHYVADIDNILDFSLKLTSLKYYEKQGAKGYSFDEMASVETVKKALLQKRSATLSLSDLRKSSHYHGMHGLSTDFASRLLKGSYDLIEIQKHGIIKSRDTSPMKHHQSDVVVCEGDPHMEHLTLLHNRRGATSPMVARRSNTVVSDGNSNMEHLSLLNQKRGATSPMVARRNDTVVLDGNSNMEHLSLLNQKRGATSPMVARRSDTVVSDGNSNMEHLSLLNQKRGATSPMVTRRSDSVVSDGNSNMEHLSLLNQKRGAASPMVIRRSDTALSEGNPHLEELPLLKGLQAMKHGDTSPRVARRCDSECNPHMEHLSLLNHKRGATSPMVARRSDTALSEGNPHLEELPLLKGLQAKKRGDTSPLVARRCDSEGNSFMEHLSVLQRQRGDTSPMIARRSNTVQSEGNSHLEHLPLKKYQRDISPMLARRSDSEGNPQMEHLTILQRIRGSTSPMVTRRSDTVLSDGNPHLEQLPLLKGLQSKKRGDSSPIFLRRSDAIISASNPHIDHLPPAPLISKKDLPHQPYSEEHLYEEIPDIKVKKKALQAEQILVKKWKDSVQVKQSGLLSKLTAREISLNEAKYNIITSEHIFLKSLKTFMNVYYSSSNLKESISEKDFHRLFGNVPEVIKCSENFLQDCLEALHGDPLMSNLSNIARTHAVTCFDPYIAHCRQYALVKKLLDILLRDNLKFRRLVREKEKKEEVRGRKLQYYLFLPCHHVTQMSLLLHKVLSQETPGTCQYREALLALNALQKLTDDCGEAVRSSEHKNQSDVVLNERFKENLSIEIGELQLEKVNFQV
ncbi:uncharacterized protein isoform X2 [Rhodnius prolixus]|uniref:uncharacterized protein isoform X2 n=1 Tax=Rhodnius prolixus TaxID=13249 RepID=UPI003D188E8B